MLIVLLVLFVVCCGLRCVLIVASFILFFSVRVWLVSCCIVCVVVVVRVVVFLLYVSCFVLPFV